MELKIEDGLPFEIWCLCTVPLITLQLNLMQQLKPENISPEKVFFFLVYNSNQPHIKTQSHLFLLT